MSLLVQVAAVMPCLASPVRLKLKQSHESNSKALPCRIYLPMSWLVTQNCDHVLVTEGDLMEVV